MVVFISKPFNLLFLKENRPQPTKKPSKDKDNILHHPLSFKFSNFEPSEKETFGPAKLELKKLYPRVHTVCFLNSKNRNRKKGKFEGWVNFLTPIDCRKTYEAMKANPTHGIVVGEMGACAEPAFEKSLTVVQTKKKEKRKIDFTKNIFADKNLKLF